MTNLPESRASRTGPVEEPRRIAVMNPKGGCGKTTVATNLASCYASQGWGTALFDYDPLAASMRWLRNRPEKHPPIHGVEAHSRPQSNVTRSWQLRIPETTSRVILDTPAGVERQQLLEQIRGVHIILVPVLPSPIDIGATADFIRDLLLVGKLRSRQTGLGIISNRVKANTRAFQALERFLATLNIPVITHLRETQNYVTAAQQGLGVHEMQNARDARDTGNWQSILDWIEHQLVESERSAPRGN